jgi:glycosyltransferase involved in cell wall biosynthesis
MAIVCARNEQVHIASCLEGFISQSIEVVLIDNDSSDKTRQCAQPFLGHGLKSIEHLEWNEKFSLSEQLHMKRQIINQSTADWVIHADADEWLQAAPGFTNLYTGIEAANAEGYNCINFDEFTFVPLSGEDFEYPGYRDRMLRYYFFEPRSPRLVRAWQKGSGLHNNMSGGHTLIGDDIRLFPENFILRHYITLSRNHACRKFLERAYSSEELAWGWHRNRSNITAETLLVRDTNRLKHLAFSESRHFDTSEAQKYHFWQW